MFFSQGWHRSWRARRRTPATSSLLVFDHTHRWFWVCLARFWPNWQKSLLLVRPETVVSWHRRGFRLFWTWISRRKRSGRPGMSRELRDLVCKMAEANPLGGAPRIHGELLKLGIEVSERTVSRLMPKRRKPPSQSWRAFLANHVTSSVNAGLGPAHGIYLMGSTVWAVSQRRYPHPYG